MPILSRDEHGSALVEFAITIPVVLAMLFGILDFGRALYTYDLVTGAAQVGSRYAMVRGPNCTGSSCTATSASIQTYVRSTLPSSDSANLNLTATWPAATGCVGGAPAAGCPVLVNAAYAFTFMFPLTLTIQINSGSQMIISR